MPTKSPAQAKLMRAAAHSPAFAKKAGVPAKVAKEFMAEDKAKSTFKGRESKAEEAAEKKAFPSKAAYAKAERMAEGEKAYKCGGGVKKYADGGAIRGSGAARPKKTRFV